MLEAKFSAHPGYNWDILRFFTQELKLSPKYVVLDLYADTGKLSKMLGKQAHLVVAWDGQNPASSGFIRQQQPHSKRINPIAAADLLEYLEEDSVDFASVGQGFARGDWRQLRQQLEQVLRLNSFVCVVLHELQNDNPFADAYLQILAQNGLKDDYQPEDLTEHLAGFFPYGYEQRIFPNQLRLNGQLFEHYALSSNYGERLNSVIMRAFRLVFQQYEQGGEVLLNYQTKVYFGLYNKYVPAISLQKSLFFALLKPFAFGFYVLVKLNVYFWRFLYKLRFIFSKK